MKGETAWRHSPTDAVSIQPWWNNSPRWEQHRLGSRYKLVKGSFAKDLRCNISERQPLWFTYRREEEEKLRRSRGKEQLAARVVTWDCWRQEFAAWGFQLVLFWSMLGFQGLLVKATKEISTHREWRTWIAFHMSCAPRGKEQEEEVDVCGRSGVMKEEEGRKVEEKEGGRTKKKVQGNDVLEEVQKVGCKCLCKE